MKKEELIYTKEPIYLKEQHQIIFGYYPQNIVGDKNSIKKLNKLSSPGTNGYYELDNVYYEKFLSWPYELYYSFSDGTPIERCKYNWFKVEPIVWDILDIKDGIYYIRTHSILINHFFDEENNDYEDSKILFYLNKEFYKKAFFLGETNIQNTNINNTNISKKLFLLSEDDCILEGFKTENLRLAKPTDYALANGCSIDDTNKYMAYWLCTQNKKRKAYTKAIGSNGIIWETDIYYNYMGVVAAAKIKL